MKVLVVGLNWMGDVIMSFPAIHQCSAGKQTAVHILTRPHLADLYKLHGGIERIWEVDTKNKLWYNIEIFGKVRRERFDRILVFPRSFRSAFTAFLCGGKERIGFVGEFRNFLLNRSIPIPDNISGIHESGLYKKLTAGAGFADTTLPFCPVGFPSEKVEGIRKRFGLPRNDPFAVFAPGAAFGEAKRWNTSGFAELAKALVKKTGFFAVTTGSVAESRLTAEVAGAATDRIYDLGGKTSIEDLAVLLSNARLVVANDSGTMHLAALFNTPLVVPVGPTDMTRTGPMSENHILVHGNSCIPPCRKRECARGDHRCMSSITPGMMLEACETVDRR